MRLSTLGRRTLVTVLALLFTHLFFFEYRTGSHRVRIPYDLEGYHYPLADYAFQSLRSGRFPLWDPTLYSGLPFAANTQAAMFYPPTWMMFAANMQSPRLPYRTMQDAVFLHLTATFLLAWLWFDWNKLHPAAALLGAAVFAFNGFVLHQLQHFGLIAGYTWIPLGFWAIDRASGDSRQFTGISMLALASSLCFLSGYTPFWVVFVVCMAAYALARPSPWRAIGATAAGIAISLLLAAVQLLPAFEASGRMMRDYRYGTGFRDPWFFLSAIVPNYYNFQLGVPVMTNPGYDMLYLGAIAIVGVPVALSARKLSGLALGGLSVFAACLFFVKNPLGLVSHALGNWPLGAQVVRDYYFLGGLAPAIAILTATGLHRRFSAEAKPVSWSTPAAALASLAALAWCARLGWLWVHGALAHGPASILDSAAAAVLVAGLLLVYGRSHRPARLAISAALLLLTATEYKVFGTSKRVNARAEDAFVVPGRFPGVDDPVYERMHADKEFRCAIDSGGGFVTDLRHYGLTSPQGFDPLLPTAYRRLVESVAAFQTDRELSLDPAREDTLRLFGVRYFISTENGRFFPYLKASSSYRLLEPSAGYYKVFEFKSAQPQYGWEADAAGAARAVRWTPELRGFAVNSPSGGKFRLSEQFMPGWSAQVDERTIAIEPCHFALQCVSVPPGEHAVEFRYRSVPLEAGALLTFVTVTLIGLWWLWTRRVTRPREAG